MTINKNQNKKAKTKYHLKNWKEYNENLKQRGSLEVWLDEDVLLSDWFSEPSGKPGVQPIYSDTAIRIVLQFGQVFHQKLRQTEGLLQSVFKQLGVKLPIPDYSTLSRRCGQLIFSVPKKSRKKEKLIVVVDSTGVKVYGEGEWKVRQHGASKRRTWRKAHLAVLPDGEIRAAELTGNDIADGDVFKKLIDQEENEIETVVGDGGYDKEKVYQACLAKKIKNILIPPQKNARIRQHGNSSLPSHPRDANLRQIRKTSLKKWKEQTEFHVRSLAETAMFRFKTIIGDKFKFRKFKNQRTELMISISILNRMLQLGMPDSYAVT
ncbi:MAG TPA: IS5 family transposase [Candidatus Nanoarchaeia archaeon]|nr:IS5 family transposase [Candidatus Nanoarchaeia archaeon]